MLKNVINKIFSITKENAHIIITIFGLKMTFKNILINPLEDCCNIPNLKYVKSKNVGFPHPIGIVIHPDVQIGNNCAIYQSVTIGSNNGKVPTIGNNVIIYPNSVIFGDITIGNNVIIGAGSIVNSDIPNNVIVAGNPARIIKKNKDNKNEI